MTNPMQDRVEELVERLNAEVPTRTYEVRAGVTTVVKRLRNPDGPAAATLLTDLSRQVEELRREADDHAEAASRWRARAGEMADALEFYADEARWRPSSNMVTPAMDDKGHRARAALPKAPEEGGGE